MKIKGYKKDIPKFKGTHGNKQMDLIKPTKQNNSKHKVRESIASLLDELMLKDGMTLSFHHHLRNGDYVLNMVMDEIHKRNLCDLTIFASAIFPCHEPLVKLIEDGVVTQIYAAYISGPVADAINQGKMNKVAVMHTHGGRPRLVESGDVTIDYAFIAAPTCDQMGNINGSIGKSACGALGYAYTDAHFAKQTIAITDHLVDDLLDNVHIEGRFVDHIINVDSIGDPEGIVSGTTKITKNPIGLRIARLATDVIKHSGYFETGFSFQTGAGGTSLAVANYLKELMKQDQVKGRFASGGITGYIVDMHEEDLFDTLYDVQCFDLDAVKSIKDNERHIQMSASRYANINDDNIVNDLDFVILGATEMDTDFNVNVTTTSTGEIMGGSGGHSDTAYGANVTIIVSQLFNARIPLIKDKVICKTTPGETVDVLVTERGIAVNPKRIDLIERFEKANLPLKTIKELKEISDQLVGKPQEIKFTDEVIGIVEYRDGTVIDYLYKKA
ncbi:citrate lyase subunit alpha [Haloplasma contractile]|uniref:Citrate lyase alpha chain n=1 Tax=Haloplasma contractile SSD-17B TaxID=1033810 RepID=U2EG03_9MOLU|nr:citrate lyase subunit alpha [Haloplasma contractile]ERJ13848.1 citrate CoA-transferase protein [Haloplasma contractile SSD-17B]